MKVAFICDLPDEHFPFWNDGLRAALDVLRDKYNWQVDIFNRKPNGAFDVFEPEDYDVGLFWSGLTNDLTNYRIFKKQALCFGGGPTYTPNIHNFDLIFGESAVDVKDFKRFGKVTLQAFGTNTKLFRPMPEQPKVFAYIYPAAFAKWKHHEKFAQFVKAREDKTRETMVLGEGEDLKMPCLAVGYMQPGGWEKECYEICQQYGISVIPQVSYDVLPYLINASESVYVAADINGGSQRTVLEAKACGVPVEIDSDSPKLLELKDLTRQDVLDKWSEEAYAERLKVGIEEILK